MAPRTSNLYGKIGISKLAISDVAIATADECYGVAAVGKRPVTKYGTNYGIWAPAKRKHAKGCKVSVEDNRITVHVSLYLKFGVTVDPVIESIRSAVKYNVEDFTGMTVECVNIDVLGITN